MEATNKEALSRVYSQVRNGLTLLGFEDRLLQEKYHFADILESSYSVRTIPLAAFAQEPPSYQNACFGVVISNGQSGIPLVSSCRSLGAPHIIEVRNDGISRWKMTSHNDPKHLEVIPTEHITRLFELHKKDWAPAQILRAKAIGEEDFASQLDFFDTGLLPLIEGEVREKLDGLLRRTVALSIEQYKSNNPNAEPDYTGLVRLLFRLVAAKILSDRNYPGNWLDDNPETVIKAVEDFYFREAAPKSVLKDYGTQAVAWNSIKKAFHFQNLSVEALAYVYENTFVSRELRTLYSIHGTPPYIAEYMVRHLPFDRLEESERTVFEPFAGHAVFLVAAMRRLRELLPPSMGTAERHEYFVKRLSGIEKEEFAWEVGRLSLMLADYPNPNGWRLMQGDAFQDARVDKEIANAGIVLCNPPFEDFKIDERRAYSGLYSIHKPLEILHRIVNHPQKPRLLGFVLPRTFLTRQAYRELRSFIGSAYGNIELVGLPDKVFRHSDAEAVILLAEGKPSENVHIISAAVDKDDLPTFKRNGTPTRRAGRDILISELKKTGQLWEPPLHQVWERLESYDNFDNIAEVHRGIEYKVPLELNRDKFLSLQLKEEGNFKKALDNVSRGFEPFFVQRYVFMDTSPEVMRRNSYLYPWDKPKVIANAARLSRGPWRIAASPDYDSLICYKNFYGIWPRTGLPIELIAAILNSPVANAYLWTFDTRENRKITVAKIPIPKIDANTSTQVTELVKAYITHRREWLSNPFKQETLKTVCGDLLAKIDAAILYAYDLPPRLERQLLDCFQGYQRPGPVEFYEYYPREFKPFIPWHKYISEDFSRARIGNTVARLPVLDDEAISKALSEME